MGKLQQASNAGHINKSTRAQQGADDAAVNDFARTNCFEPFPPAIDFFWKGNRLFVYSRAEISRTVALVVALLLAAVSTGAVAREFRAADTQNEDYPTVQALRYMGGLIAEQTGGRLTDPRLSFTPARRGKGDHRADPGRRHRSQPHQCGADRQLRASDERAGDAVSVPLHRASAEGAGWPDRRAKSSTVSSRIGFVGLAFYDSGARSIYNSVRPVRSIADLKGLRIRVQQSELMSDMIRALGAEPVELPYGQVLTGLATRLIDGAENNWPSFVTTDHYKYAGYYTLTEHTMGPEVLVMSRKAWESLSAEDRKIFREAALAVEPLHARKVEGSRGAVAPAGRGRRA